MKRSIICIAIFLFLAGFSKATAPGEELIFQYDHTPTQQDYDDLAAQGCEVVYVPRHLNLLIVNCTEQENSMRTLQRENPPYQIWENEIFTPTLSDGAQIIEAIQAWNSSYNGSGVKIGVMDTGINTNHTALAGQFDAEVDFYDGGTAEDLCNHGTPVAGIISSLNETYKGIAHGARFYNLKVGQQIGGGQCGASSSDIIEAIDYSVENGINVVSMSIGGAISNCSLSISANYVNEAVAQDGIPIVIAAGNSGPSNNSIYTPGCAKNAITVGSIDKNGALSSFSSRGPVNDYNKPDILAPGRNIISTSSDGTFQSGFTGTSFATPFITGVVALMLQANPGLNWTQIKEVLANSSTDLGYAENEQGAGLANASKAIEIALTVNTTRPTYNKTIAIFTKTADVNTLNASNNTIIEYQINLTIENGTADNTTIIENYPSELEFVNATPNPTTGNNIWEIGNLTAGQNYQINITLNFTGNEELTLVNNANATFTNQTGKQNNLSAQQNTSVVFNEPILPTTTTITKTSSTATLNLSNTTILEYQINFTVQNGTAVNVTINEAYPANTTFINSTPPPTSEENIWLPGNLTQGQTYQINITINVSQTLENGTIITNKVNATYFNGTGQKETKEANQNTTIAKNPPIVYEDFPGLLVFSRNTSNATYKDIYSNLTLGNNQNFQTTGTPNWIVLQAAPNRNETIMIIQNSGNGLHFYTHKPEGNFSNGTQLTSNTGGAQRRFDAKYDINGNAMIVYSTSNSTPSYTIWNGTGFPISGVLPQDSCTNNTAWIQLATSPNSNKMITMYMDTSGRYCAQVWNGTAWGNSKHFTTDSGFSTEKFSIEFEHQSGHALAVFESPTQGVISYCEWTGSWCASNTDLSDRGSQNDWIRLSPEPTSDRIILGTYQSGNGDVEAIEWNGSKFGTWKSIDTSVETGGDRIFDISYVGSTGKAMITYVDNNQKVPSFSTCNNTSSCFSGTWNSNSFTTNTTNNCGELFDLDFVKLTSQKNSNTILLTGLSQANHYKCAQFYNGTSWQTWISGLGNGSSNLATEDISAIFDAD